MNGPRADGHVSPQDGEAVFMPRPMPRTVGGLGEVSRPTRRALLACGLCPNHTQIGQAVPCNRAEDHRRLAGADLHMDGTGGALRPRRRPELQRAPASSGRDRAGAPGARHPLREWVRGGTVGSSRNDWFADTGTTGPGSLSRWARRPIETAARSVGVSGSCMAVAKTVRTGRDGWEPIRRIHAALRNVALGASTPRRRPHRPDARRTAGDSRRPGSCEQQLTSAGWFEDRVHPADLVDRTAPANRGCLRAR